MLSEEKIISIFCIVDDMLRNNSQQNILTGNLG